MSEPVILLDCDGVLADFIHPFLEIANAITGLNKTLEDVLDWHTFSLYPEHSHKWIQDAIAQTGWCSSLSPMPGAKEAVEALRKMGHVYCATSPWSSPTWCSEREKWLQKHFGFERNEVIQIHDKWILQGALLVDDKVETLVKWADTTGNVGVLWSQPYNRSFRTFGNIWRAQDWDDVLSYTKAILHEKASQDPSLKARKAYIAYGDSTGGLNFRGEPMPLWPDLPEKIRQAWHAAVSAVCR